MADRMRLDIELACGRHFKYRDLIECGKTWRALSSKGFAIDNTPDNPGSRRALRQLCLKVLDPLVDQFGPVVLTYGFSSVGLASKIKSGIAPSLDQHAAHETR